MNNYYVIIGTEQYRIKANRPYDAALSAWVTHIMQGRTKSTVKVLENGKLIAEYPID